MKLYSSSGRAEGVEWDSAAERIIPASQTCRMIVSPACSAIRRGPSGVVNWR